MGVSNGPSQLRATNVIIAKHLVAVLEILCPPASQRSIGSPSLPGNPSQSPLKHLEKIKDIAWIGHHFLNIGIILIFII